MVHRKLWGKAGVRAWAIVVLIFHFLLRYVCCKLMGQDDDDVTHMRDIRWAPTSWKPATDVNRAEMPDLLSRSGKSRRITVFQVLPARQNQDPVSLPSREIVRAHRPPQLTVLHNAKQGATVVDCRITEI